MCITQVWKYRECGCHYHHHVPCHPSFTANSTIPRRLKAGTHLSTASSLSDLSSTSTDGSTSTSNDSLQGPSHQCSMRRIVHKSFLEPICDDCLLEELGLQPELGPLLGGRDLQEGLHGEEWLLESSVEIKIEEDDNSKDLGAGSGEDDDEEMAYADDEGEVHWRSGRRRGLDISRDALRISSDLSADERGGLLLSGEELNGTGLDSRKGTRTVHKARNGRRRLTPYWPQQLRKGLSRNKGVGKRPTKSLGGDRTSLGSSVSDLGIPPQIIQDLEAEEPKPEDKQLLSNTLPGDGRDTSFDHEVEIISLYGANPEQDNYQDAKYPSWSEHLTAELQERHMTQNNGTAARLDLDTLRQYPRSPSSVRSSTQTVTPLYSAFWQARKSEPLNISSSEFDKEETTTLPTPPTPASHAHTKSIDSTLSNSDFGTAHSRPSSPRHKTTTASTPSTPSTPPTTATSTTQLSLHPLSTVLTITTPHRPPFTPRTSSLRSPPASSPLLHSTPPLHQSPTSVFVCVHERWAFRGCGCDGPSWVRSCVCDHQSHVEQGDEGEQDDADAKNGCRAAEPLVRTRWFFNPDCEACLGREDASGGTGRRTNVEKLE